MNHETRFSTAGTIYASKESTWSVLLSERLYDAIWGAELKKHGSPALPLSLMVFGKMLLTPTRVWL